MEKANRDGGCAALGDIAELPLSCIERVTQHLVQGFRDVLLSPMPPWSPGGGRGEDLASPNCLRYPVRPG